MRELPVQAVPSIDLASSLSAISHKDAVRSTASEPRVWRNPRLAGRIVELDGIRGLAILLVLVWHYSSWFQAAPGSWKAHLLASLRLTWSGVDLFFVLSGFLIGGILYDAKRSKGYYQTFYRRRIFRIFPLYFLWLALFSLGVYLVDHNESWRPLQATFNHDLPRWSYALFLQNFLMSARRTFGPEWMGITWSLAVEEQFYLFLPLLVRNLSYRGITWLALASIVIAPMIRLFLWQSGNYFLGPYTLLPARADALAFGVLVALACRSESAWKWLASHRRALYGALIMLGCGMLVLTRRQSSQVAAFRSGLEMGGLTWIAAFYAVLLVLVIVQPRPVESRFLKTPILVKLGTVAYAVYIFHLGVWQLFHFVLFNSQRDLGNRAWLMLSALSLLTTLVLAAISWRFLEKPLIRHAHAAYRYSGADEIKVGEP